MKTPALISCLLVLSISSLAVAAEPGQIKGFAVQPAQTAVADTPVSFTLDGSGQCTVNLASGDGVSTNKSGVLPFVIPHTYSAKTMLSYEAHRKYTAVVKALGDCQFAAGVPHQVEIKVSNPNVQPLQGSTPGKGPMSAAPAVKNGVAGDGKKPGRP